MCAEPAVSAEPQQKTKRQFPAKIEIVSSKQVADGRRELEVVITPEEDVQIYTDLEAHVPVADLTIRTVDGTQVPAEVLYLKSSAPDADSQKSGYVGKLRYSVKFVAPANNVSLKVHCKLAGWNQQKAYCLGFGRISADLPMKQ